MPHKDLEARKAYMNAYNERRREARRIYNKERYRRETERLKTKSREHHYKNRDRILKALRVRRAENPEKYRIQTAVWRRANPERLLLNTARSRARSLQVPFNLSREDINIPKTCPVLGIDLLIGTASLHSPTLDRMRPELGYVKGNVRVISWRANRLKSDGTVEEFRLILEYMAELR